MCGSRSRSVRTYQTRQSSDALSPREEGVEEHYILRLRWQRRLSLLQEAETSASLCRKSRSSSLGRLQSKKEIRFVDVHNGGGIVEMSCLDSICDLKQKLLQLSRTKIRPSRDYQVVIFPVDDWLDAELCLLPSWPSRWDLLAHHMMRLHTIEPTPHQMLDGLEMPWPPPYAACLVHSPLPGCCDVHMHGKTFLESISIDSVDQIKNMACDHIKHERQQMFIYDSNFKKTAVPRDCQSLRGLAAGGCFVEVLDMPASGCMDIKYCKMFEHQTFRPGVLYDLPYSTTVAAVAEIISSHLGIPVSAGNLFLEHGATALSCSAELAALPHNNCAARVFVRDIAGTITVNIHSVGGELVYACDVDPVVTVAQLRNKAERDTGRPMQSVNVHLVELATGQILGDERQLAALFKANGADGILSLQAVVRLLDVAMTFQELLQLAGFSKSGARGVLNWLARNCCTDWQQFFRFLQDGSPGRIRIISSLLIQGGHLLGTPECGHLESVEQKLGAAFDLFSQLQAAGSLETSGV